ncbi:MAG: DUF1428 domain-containing protein [Pseudomonadota bacterium]
MTGCVAAVPAGNKEAFLAHAKIAAEVFRDFGALAVHETWGVDVPEGEVTSMPMAVKAEPGEVVAFSWIIWPNREVADAAMGSIMEDPRMNPAENPMPFDAKRMIFGGFETILEA